MRRTSCDAVLLANCRPGPPTAGDSAAMARHAVTYLAHCAGADPETLLGSGFQLAHCTKQNHGAAATDRLPRMWQLCAPECGLTPTADSNVAGWRQRYIGVGPTWRMADWWDDESGLARTIASLP